MNLSELSHIEVNEMMRGKNKVVLLHANKYYLLSITRRGKLILTLAEGEMSSPKSEDAVFN